MSLGDWAGPLLFFLSSLLVLVIDQSLDVLTNGREPSWTVIFVIPLLMVIKKFLTQGVSKDE